MLKYIFIVLLSFNLYSQKDTTIKLNLDNNISFIYSNPNNINQYGTSYNGTNSIGKNNVTFLTNSNYSLNFTNKIIGHDWLQKTNISYKRVFISHVFNYSLSRHIETDNAIGCGIGFKYKIISLSYALMYQNTNYIDKPIKEVLRHSVRLKLKLQKKLFNFTTEYYYQPNINNINDVIIYGNTKITLYPQNKINFIIQDAMNYRSLSNIKLIHNFTVGFGYTFKTK